MGDGRVVVVGAEKPAAVFSCIGFCGWRGGRARAAIGVHFRFVETPMGGPVGTGCRPAGLSAASRSRPGAIASVLAGSFFIGALVSSIASSTQVPQPLPSRRWIRLEGEVEQLRHSGDSTSMRLAVARAMDQTARFRASLIGPPVPELEVGQRAIVGARLKPLSPPLNPGEANTATLATRRAQPYVGVFEKQRLVPLSPPPPFAQYLRRTHAALFEKVQSVCPDNEAAGLVMALAAGERQQLGDDFEEAFANSGLAHVLSVSGLHVAVLAMTFFSVVAVAVGRSPRSCFAVQTPARIAAPLVVPLVWMYVAFTGFEVRPCAQQ